MNNYELLLPFTICELIDELNRKLTSQSKRSAGVERDLLQLQIEEPPLLVSYRSWMSKSQDNLTS